ncbi:MAG TPA: hypothetical protein VI935_11000 [Thermodesulfobacteriota bacterium]|nr:hypothetical protein [Thermodesulfobacteriota bacterium]
MTVKGLLVLFTIFALSSNLKFSVISQGLTNKIPSFNNLVVKNQEVLKRVWDSLGIVGEVPIIDFKKELVIVIVPKGRIGSAVEVSTLEQKTSAVEVRYVVIPVLTDSKTHSGLDSPYLIAKLFLTDPQKLNVKFIEDLPKPPIPEGTSIGRLPVDASVLRQYSNNNISQYFPLDRGNVWTYRVESQGRSYDETYSILSVSQDGWSIFDNFFGQKNIALRIDPFGIILITSDKGTRTFYNLDIQHSYKHSEFVTLAGKFDDLMVVTVPDGDKFWFKDVYAKGVGLIYHEHKSPKGLVKYTLINAEVSGKEYP